MALIDVTVEPISGERFPGNDSVAHASLLWLDRMLATLTDDIEATATVAPDELADEPDIAVESDDGAEPDGDVLRRPPSIAARRLSRADGDRAWDEMFADYGTRFAREARERPERFKAQCVELLDRFGLVRRHGAHLEVFAVAARYRAVASMPAPKRHDPNQQELFA
jgi:hypothetical protein